MLTRISCFDQRTTYGRNLKNISDECKVSVDKLNNATVKKLMKFKEIPENEAWRAKLVDELLGAKFGNLNIELTIQEIEDILNYTCSS